jgi:uncharacterized protein (DUF2164 family)
METPIETSASQFKMVDDPSQLSMFQNKDATQTTNTPAASQAAPVAPAAPAQPDAPAQNTPVVNIEQEVVNFMSEKLGKKFTSFDEITNGFNSAPQYEIDERVKAINDFVRTTGRSPEDWYLYQSYDPSKMDDLSAIKTQFTLAHPNLNSKEVDMLIKSKYKVGDDFHLSEEDAAMQTLQLKIDAEEARKSIDAVRNQYASKAPAKQEDNSPVTEDWIREMSGNVSDIEAIEFGLPNGGKFAFGIDPAYKPKLIDKNKNLDNFFGEYVNKDGKWNFEKFNSHRILLDNIDQIVSSVYNQGISDGQRKVVETHANITGGAPQIPFEQGNQLKAIHEQVKSAIGGDKKVVFRV